MRVVVTGGSGFLGSLLARSLLTRDLSVGGATPGPVGELVLLDLVAPAPELAADPRVRVLTGPLTDTLDDVDPSDLVFHLAGVVSGAAEADLDLGMATNLDATRALLDRCRALPGSPVLVFSSSLAVFGRDPALGPVGTVHDDTRPTPQSSYGTQKLIGELLLADHTRRGLVRGRSVRLMTVSVRPGRPNAAASSFLSGIVREPVAGERAVCPVPLDTPVALSSPGCTVEGLLRAAEADDAAWGSTTALTLPALTTTPREMLQALDRAVGAGTSNLVERVEDPAVQAIVASWPAVVDAARARTLGLEPPADMDAVIAEYLATSADRGR